MPLLGQNTIKPTTIDQICAQLRSSGIHGVDAYQQRLRDNERDEERLHDFFCEGYVALAFSKQGWAITMRERPDLEGWLNGIYLGIEVKHFRYKPDHDPIEDAAILIDGVSEATWIPWLSETEGREDAWDQMCRFAKENAHQYADRELNLIFFCCSTQAHSYVTLTTAVNIYDEAIQKPSCPPGMKNLSAMMMMNDDWAKFGYDARSIFWKPIRFANKPVTPELSALLDEIRFP